MTVQPPSFEHLSFAPPQHDPGSSQWVFPSPNLADERGFLGVGADIAPATLLAAYRAGIFPMPERRKVGWWSPDPRGVLELHQLRVSKSLRASCHRYEVRVDTRFRDVMTACATQPRPGGWINQSFIESYTHLHALGWAHSVETFDSDGSLVGGLYGIRINGLFAGESMFSNANDASKVALVALVDILRRGEVSLLDVQWTTPHLVSLGAADIDRSVYLQRLQQALHSTKNP